MYGIDTGLLLPGVTPYILLLQEALMQPSDVTSCEHFVSTWFRSKKYEMQPNGHFDGMHLTTFDRLWLEYEEKFELISLKYSLDCKAAKINGTSPPIKPRKIAESNMLKAWGIFLQDEQTRAVDVIRNKIRHTPTGDNELRKWLMATMGTSEEFYVAVLKHVIWQVKRKLYNQEVVHHFCPVLWGEQGGGKSTAIKKLLAPIDGLVLTWNVPDAIDGRNTQTLADNYVCFFDEMSGVGKVDVEALKRIVTADTTSYRPLRTNQHLKVKQNCSFIGASNRSISQNVYDPTGLRRFVEITGMPKVDWNMLDTIHPLTIWQSIDENLDRGYIEPFLPEMYAKQKAAQVIDDVTDFIRSLNITPVVGEKTLTMTIKDLHDRYKLWRIPFKCRLWSV
jgi:predicted P-loop ATPase